MRPFVVVDVLVGLVLAGCGQAAWRLEPSGRAGSWMTAAAAAWLMGTAALVLQEHSAWTYPLYAMSGYHDLLLVALVLGYPGGRLRGRAAQAAVAALAGLYLAGSVLRLLFFQPAVYFGCPCPVDPLAVVVDAALFDAASGLVGRAIGSVIAVVAVVEALRWLRASMPARRVAFLMPVATIVLAALFVQDTWLRPVERLLVPEPAAFYVLAAARAAIPLAYVAGLLALRLAESRIADLVRAVGAGLRRDRLEPTLAKVLGDARLEVWWWDPDRRLFTRDGREAREPQAGPGRDVTRIDSGVEPVAALCHDASLAENPRLAEAVSSAVRLAMDNQRLEQEVRRRLDEVHASRVRLLAAADVERARLERDLHDGSQQWLVSLALALRMTRRRIDETADPALATALDDASDELAQALTDLRELARGIHPAILTDGGLAAALPALAERCPVPVRLQVRLHRRLEPTTESTLYFAVSECLTNVARYAGAGCCELVVDDAGDHVTVRVTDNGSGGADPGRGSGLRGLRDRAEALGGRLAVASPAGGGTAVTVTVPIRETGASGPGHG